VSRRHLNTAAVWSLLLVLWSLHAPPHADTVGLRHPNGNVNETESIPGGAMDSDLKKPGWVERLTPGEDGTLDYVEPIGLARDRVPRRWDIPVYQSGTVFTGLQGDLLPETIVDDFLVNDDSTGGCSQGAYPAIAKNPAGGFVVTWVDGRGGYAGVYAQRYDPSGIPNGSNFRVNEIPLALSSVRPAVSMDNSSNFVIVWVGPGDLDGEDFCVYAQRYDSSGTPLGYNCRVNDELEEDRPHPSIAMHGSGNFVIVWEHEYDVFPPEPPDILAQRYDSSGAPLGSNFIVNDGAGGAVRPDVAMDGLGDFVVTWQDDRNGSSDIYAQRYDSSGSPLGSNYQVNDDVMATSGVMASVAVSPSGDFAIAWQYNAGTGGVDIYAQRYDSLGHAQGSNFRVNDDPETASQFQPDIAVDDSCNFVITWNDLRNVGRDVYAQRYDCSGAPLGSNFIVNDDTAEAMQLYPAIGASASGEFVITFWDYRNPTSDIYAQRFDSSGTPLGSNFKVNDEVGSTSQIHPVIASSGSGNFVIAWEDFRDLNGDIYAQRYDSSGNPLGTNIKVNDDVGDADQEWPAAAMDALGNFLIAWTDHRNDTTNVYAQRFDPLGTRLGSNFKVNEGGAGSSPAVAMYGSGDFTVTWYHYDYPEREIYAQRYNSSGTPLGSNFRVNDDTTDLQFEPAIAVDSSGNSVITWRDDRNYPLYAQDIYAQRYNSAGTPLGANFRVNDDSMQETQWAPAVAMDASGNFVITWWGFYIYAQRYDSSGNALDSNFQVSENYPEPPWPRYPPAIAVDESGNFTIAWEDWRHGELRADIYARTYCSSGEPLGHNYSVANSEHATFSQESPGVAANGSNFCFTWTDNRRAKGWDIYANIKTFSHPPDHFSLLFPPQKAFTPRRVRFDWEDSADPNQCDEVRYDLLVSNSYQFPPAETTIDSNLTASEHKKTLDYGTYFWKVRAKDNSGAETESGQIRRFMVTGIAHLDFNQDGAIDVADVVLLARYFYASGPAPDPLESVDMSCDGSIDIGDLIFLINYLLKAGPLPCEP
jgi:hypothetical protein